MVSYRYLYAVRIGPACAEPSYLIVLKAGRLVCWREERCTWGMGVGQTGAKEGVDGISVISQR